MASARSFLTSALCLLPFALFALQTPAQTPSQPPQFRAGVDVFQLEVSVFDKSREPIQGLHSSNFSVYENGKLQPIVAFEEVELPEYDGPQPESKEDTAPDVQSARYADRRLIVIVMDDWDWPPDPQSHLGCPKDLEKIPQTREAAKFMASSIGAADLVSVTLTRDLRYFPDFTNNPWKLEGNIGKFEPLCRESAQRQYIEMLAQQNMRGIGLIPALDELIDRISKLPQHQKAIVLIAHLNGRGGGVSPRLVGLMDRARQFGITISGIDIGSYGMPGLGNQFLLTLAENTGGVAVSATNDLMPGMAQIFKQHHSYYLIGYQQTGPKDGKFRKLEVRLDRPGLVVRTRSGYTAAGPADMVKATPLPYDEVAEKAISAMEDTSSTRRLYTYATAEPGLIHAAVEISSREVQAGKWAGGGTVNVRVLRGTGGVLTTTTGTIEPGARGALFEIPLKDADGRPLGLEAGPFHVSMQVVSDRSSLDDGLDAATAGQLIGEPLVYRLASGPRAQPHAVAEFQFLRTERIRIEWPALDVIDPAQVRLLRRTGETINVAPAVTERTDNGRKILSCELPLSILGASEYLIDIVVQHGDRAERKVVAFRVVQ